MAARVAHNHKAVGSNPTPANFKVGQLDHDALEQLRTALIPTSSGKHWSPGASKDKKRKTLTFGGPPLAYQLGTLGPVDDMIKAELIWLSASPAADYPKLTHKMLFRVNIAQIEIQRFSIETVIACREIGQYVYKQAVLLEQDFVGRSIKIAMFPRGRQGKRIVAEGTMQTRTITYNGPRTFEIDRPLKTVGPDLVASFNDPQFGRKIEAIEPVSGSALRPLEIDQSQFEKKS